MTTERAELKQRFEQMDDDELLRRYRSGDMTAMAMEVAVESLRERNLPSELPSSQASLPGTDQVSSDMEDIGDVVCLRRVASPVQAELLCGLLDSEGVSATAADANLVRVNPMLSQAYRTGVFSRRLCYSYRRLKIATT